MLAAGKHPHLAQQHLLDTRVDGLPLIVAVARRMRPILPHTLAVVRPEDVAIMRYLTDEGLFVVPCPDGERGLGQAIACGVVASATANGWVVLPADNAAIQAGTLAGIVGLLAHEALLAVARCDQQQGYPVGFDKRMREQLLMLEGDHGPDQLLAQQADDVRYFDVEDKGVLVRYD